MNTPDKCPHCFNAEQDAELLAMSVATLKARIAQLESIIRTRDLAERSDDSKPHYRGLAPALAARNEACGLEEGDL